MAIENRHLEVGTRLVAKFKGQTHHAEVVAGEAEGSKLYRVAKQTYKSPSAAGSAVMGGTACNGWRFWSVEDGKPAKTTKKPEQQEQPSEPEDEVVIRQVVES